MLLDDEAWQTLEAAETCEVVCEQMMSTLHPYHHTPALMYQLNLMKLPPSSRAQFLLQHSEARVRLYQSFCAEGLAHPLVANDIEASALAMLDAGDADGAAQGFEDAAARFGSFYGAASADATRCRAAAGCRTLDEYAALGPRALQLSAHH